ncbi:hypothetical protein V6N13_139905 [Hibiscus sabdariffa]|uniref:Peptidylprolyl isomerase n=1 Tax=Hibiscus sabdariffa TaxID=183260 RepID=A0ABR2QBQ3_9ROSI
MGRRPSDPEHSQFASLVLLLVALFSCRLVYAVVSTLLNPTVNSENSIFASLEWAVSVAEASRIWRCGGLTSSSILPWNVFRPVKPCVLAMMGLACATLGFSVGTRRLAGRDLERVSLRWKLSTAPYGPPFALIQGVLEAEGTPFKKIPVEACPTVTRGSIAWVGSGPEFFISLANHEKWKNSYTVFSSVRFDSSRRHGGCGENRTTCNEIQYLKQHQRFHIAKACSLVIRRMKKSLGDLNTNVKSG